MEPIVLILLHLLRTGNTDAPVMADPEAVDHKSVIPIYHRPDEIAASKSGGK